MVTPDDVPDYRGLLDLQGRALLVIGAGQGIGRQVAHALSQASGRVACVDRDAARAATVAREVDGLPIAADVTDPAQVEAMFRQANDHFGSLHGAIDIVGGSAGGWVPDIEPSSLPAAFDLNLTHAVLVASIGAPYVKPGGSFTFVGSVAGLTAIPRQAIYGAAKAALHHFIACTAAEFGHRGIRVNGVAPGFVRTPRMEARFGDAGWDELAAATPLQRVGLPMEIAGPLLFLASDLASYVTGQVLVADGGMVGPLRAMRAGTSMQLAGTPLP